MHRGRSKKTKMVKFGRELEAEVVPEWKDMYINYKLLKKPIKMIMLLRHPKPDQSPDPVNVRGSILGPFRGLARMFSGWFQSSGDNSGQVSTIPLEGHESEDKEEAEEFTDDHISKENRKTEVAQLVSLEESQFKTLLENEAVKVDEFHQLKEAELVERFTTLSKQLLTLLHLRRILSYTHLRRDNLLTTSTLTSFRQPSSSVSSARHSIDLSYGTWESEVAIEEAGIASAEEVEAVVDKLLGKTDDRSLKIDVGPEGCTTTNNGNSLKAISMFVNLLRSHRRDESRDFMEKKIQSAEKMIRVAYIDIYMALFRLQSFSSLNMLGFTKIMKKFDKVTDGQESATYLTKVKGMQFATSDKVRRLTMEVEGLFTQHFGGNDRKKAMKLLKPTPPPHSPIASFLVGVLTGCSVTLFIVYTTLISHLFVPPSETAYMETVYPVFSIFALLSLHLFMYGCNLLLWKAKRINYIFILNFQSRTALKHIDAFLICTSLMAIVVISMIIQLLLKSKGLSPTIVDTTPAFLLLIFIVVLICPLNIFYRPTRYYFLRVIRNIVGSPFFKVLMVDFFMADQLTSQIPLLRHIETTTCYYTARTFRTHDFETCKSGKHYRQLAYVISFSPYYWRAMQCVRRWIEESNTTHLANAGKYVSAMVAACARLRFAQQKGSFVWFIVVLVTCVIATIYQLYWDFVRDWGLLNRSSKNRWLRDDLMLKNKSIYYISIVVNVVLRVAWLESVLKFKVGAMENGFLDFLIASLEVIRRGQWNFYRLENEHLSNAGQFRAEKSVTLPFRETYSDE